MKTRGAVLREQPGKFEILELDLEEPRQGELMVKMAASGLCHSDDSMATGHMGVGKLPMCAGHEGSAVVTQVGPNTPGWSVGDHVVLSCLTSCGRCSYCAAGMGNLCDLNATLLLGSRFDDPTSYRMSLDGEPVGQWCGVSTFSEYSTVAVTSAVKIDPSIPLDKACLVGCGVNTGWGSGFNMAHPKPGHTVIVMGIGGIGAFALQGAAHGGATNVIAVDPVQFKREKAMEIGATHAASSIEEATELAQSLTNGQGADSAIITVGILEMEHIAQAAAAIRKAGTVVVTALGDSAEVGVPLNMFEFTLFQKRLQGSMFGGVSPMGDITKMLTMYQAGQLKLDEIITTTYALDDIHQGYADMHAGKNIRGVIVY
jgi:S-(hydroxymethyl)glutathione dehydrogenase/alcohol dehydrogenase